MREYKRFEPGTIGHRQYTCMRKISHPTEARARKSAKEHRKKYGPKMNVYKCYYCNGWHLGRKTSKHVIRQRQNNVQSELLQKEQV